MRHIWQYLCLIIATSLLGAGEYSMWSPGFVVSLSRDTTSHKGLLSTTDDNIKHANVNNLLGIGLTSQLRLGELCSGTLSSLALVPTVDLSLGVVKAHSSKSNLDHVISNNDHILLSNVILVNKNKVRMLTLSIPLRWYFATANAAYGGAFIECGPLICNIKYIDGLQINGTTIAEKPFAVTEKKSSTKTSYGLVTGIGKVNIYDEHQIAYGLSLHTIRAKDSSAKSKYKSQFKTNLYCSWTF